MSEHIKTGEEIRNSIETEFNPNAEKIELESRWVSLSWLKKQIEQRINECAKTKNGEYERLQLNDYQNKRLEDFIDCYYNILSLLEEK